MGTVQVGFRLAPPLDGDPEDTIVWFEADTADPWIDAASGSQIVGDFGEHLDTIATAARAAAEKLRALSPDEITISFGVKAGGSAHWIIAKGTAEANFQVTLTWSQTESAT